MENHQTDGYQKAFPEKYPRHSHFFQGHNERQVKQECPNSANHTSIDTRIIQAI